MANDRISRMRRLLFLEDEDHEQHPWGKFDDFYQASRDAAYLQLKRKLSPGVTVSSIKTWHIDGWSLNGRPVFTGYLGDEYQRKVWFYGGVEFKPTSIAYGALDLHASDEFAFVVTLPDMHLCLKRGFRERILKELDNSENGK